VAQVPTHRPRVEPLADRLLGPRPRRPDGRRAARLAGWGSPVPRLRGGASRQDVEEAAPRVGRGGAARCAGRATSRAPSPGRSADRARLRGVRSGKVGPDFTVTFRGTQRFNLEVTRLRLVPDTTGFAWPLLAKLRQFPPSAPNTLVVAIDGTTADALDVAATARSLRSSADAKDESFFADRGFEGTRGFYERYLRLSAVLVWCEGAAGDARASLWTNRSARIPLPERAARACVECLRAD
jgi:hypothetical protein